MNKIIVLMCAFFVSGCAVGQKTDYQGLSDFNIYPQNKKVIVAVHDMRPYVQDSTSAPTYVGSLRSLYGIPYDIKTKSGRPLADDFGEMIVSTMNAKGSPATQQIIPYNSSFNDFKQQSSGALKGSRLFYIKMAEWKTDTYMNAGFFYDLHLHVYDDQFNEVASNEQKGEFTFDQKQPGKENLASATSDILGKLFDIKEISSNVETTPVTQDQTKELEKPTIQKVLIAKDDPLFKSVPPEVKIVIKMKCAKDFPKDFAMQADCARKQTEGWMKLNE